MGEAPRAECCASMWVCPTCGQLEVHSTIRCRLCDTKQTDGQEPCAELERDTEEDLVALDVDRLLASQPSSSSPMRTCYCATRRRRCALFVWLSLASLVGLALVRHLSTVGTYFLFDEPSSLILVGCSNSSSGGPRSRTPASPLISNETLSWWAALGLVDRHSGQFLGTGGSEDRARNQALGEIMRLGGPIALIEFLSAEDPSCHTVGHAIGEEVFVEVDRDVRAAVDRCAYRCTGGCFHGVMNAYVLDLMERAGTHPGAREPVSTAAWGWFHHGAAKDLATLGPPLAALCCMPSVLHITTQGECSHGVGHALMLSRAMDLRLALQFCTKVLGAGSADHPHSLAHYCSGGVIMQDRMMLRGDQRPGYRRPAGRTRGGTHWDTLEAAVAFCAQTGTVPAGAQASCFYYGLREWFVRCEAVHPGPYGDCPNKGEVEEVEQHEAGQQSGWELLGQETPTSITGGNSTSRSTGSVAWWYRAQRIARGLVGMCTDLAASPSATRGLIASCLFGVGSALTVDLRGPTHAGSAAFAAAAGGMAMPAVSGAGAASGRGPVVAFTCGLVGDNPAWNHACIHGALFRAGKKGWADLVPAICAAFDQPDDVQFCLRMGGKHMYSMTKEQQFASYQDGRRPITEPLP